MALTSRALGRSPVQASTISTAGPALSPRARNLVASLGEEASSASNHEQQFTNVFTAEHDALFRLAYLLTDDRSEAEELVQEAFTRWYARIGSVENPSAFLRTLILNQARGTFRKQIVRRKRQYLFAVRESAVSDSEPDVLLDVVAKLPMRQRAVIVLRFYEGRNEAEIAELMNCPPGTVKSLLSRGLQTIRREVER